MPACLSAIRQNGYAMIHRMCSMEKDEDNHPITPAYLGANYTNMTSPIGTPVQ